jgi:hypothetical protein
MVEACDPGRQGQRQRTLLSRLEIGSAPTWAEGAIASVVTPVVSVA